MADTVLAPVKPAIASKVNWIAGLTAAVAALNETTDFLQQALPFIPPKYQHLVTAGIAVAGGVATIITRTFFTTSLTPSSAGKA